MSQPSPNLPSPDELPDDVPTLQALVRELLAVVAAQQEQIRELTERLNRNSGNSSRPPSSDPPWRQRSAKPLSGRKPGGQKGHPGKCRRLAPPSVVDQIIPVLPSQCDHCGGAFSAELPRRRVFRRHQVTELPPIRPTLTEYQLYARRCRACHRRTWAELPAGVPRRCVGPRVQALAALLAGACRVSRRQVQRLLQDLCGVSLSLGTLCALEADTAQALATPYAEVAAALPAAPVLGVDETSWREGGTLHWLWAAVTPRFAFYRLDRHRSRAAFEALLPPLPTTEGANGAGGAEKRSGPLIISDRYSAYGHLPPEQRSLCWAHLARDFRAAFERGGVDAVVGRWVLDVCGKLLAPWRRYRHGELTRETARAEILTLREDLRTPLRWGAEPGTRATRALCADLLTRWASLWTWLDLDDGEPTSNATERALRPAVLWRKGSFGHQSESGELFVERLLTVTTTLRLQSRNLWEYLVQACEAAVHHEPAPALLIQASA